MASKWSVRRARGSRKHCGKWPKKFRGGSSHIFLRKDGRRAVYGDVDLFQKDPFWRDLILFYEYFNGDNGAGLGASHQTGWTALVAKLIEQSGE